VVFENASGAFLLCALRWQRIVSWPHELGA
jgi:hypothetical protein